MKVHGINFCWCGPGVASLMSPPRCIASPAKSLEELIDSLPPPDTHPWPGQGPSSCCCSRSQPCNCMAPSVPSTAASASSFRGPLLRCWTETWQIAAKGIVSVTSIQRGHRVEFRRCLAIFDSRLLPEATRCFQFAHASGLRARSFQGVSISSSRLMSPCPGLQGLPVLGRIDL